MKAVIKKYIVEYGANACLFAVEYFESNNTNAYQTHKETANKFEFPFIPSKSGRYIVGRGLINAGRFIREYKKNSL